jgi:hypothetical protein
MAVRAEPGPRKGKERKKESKTPRKRKRRGKKSWEAKEME